MKSVSYKAVLFFSLVLAGCVTEFLPKISEDQNLLVVEGLITDQPNVYKVKLSRSMPLGTKATPKPETGCSVTIIDDLGNAYQLTESSTSGTYITDSLTFRGVVGREYTLHINTNNLTTTHHTYESLPVVMKAVPPIDSLFYEKVTIQEPSEYSGPKEGSQVYLNTHDPEGTCRFYRWDYTETWEFVLPYNVTNRTCWITNNSTRIIIKNTTALSVDRITRYPLNFISNETDRLSVRYSILANQYSVSEDEYAYLEKLQNISEDVGSLYDVTPSSITGNVFCIEDPGEQVLGYFSVSAKASKRIYTDENFRGLVELYNDCENDTVSGGDPIYGLNSWVWIIISVPLPPPGYVVTTIHQYCADCTTRGTTTKPDFWEDYK